MHLARQDRAGTEIQPSGYCCNRQRKMWRRNPKVYRNVSQKLTKGRGKLHHRRSDTELSTVSMKGCPIRKAQCLECPWALNSHLTSRWTHIYELSLKTVEISCTYNEEGGLREFDTAGHMEGKSDKEKQRTTNLTTLCEQIFTRPVASYFKIAQVKGAYSVR